MSIDEKTRVDKFLRKYEMHYESINISSLSRAIIEEMEKGLRGEAASLDMIPTYISLTEGIPLNEPVIVIDAGGTNFRVALVTFGQEGYPQIDYSETWPMPGSRGEIDKAEFYKRVVLYLQPVISKSRKIGFCFSYPTDILPNKDGRLRTFNKEVRVRGMENELIGSGLRHALKEAYGVDVTIVMLNDTVATLLGGKAAYPSRKFSSYVGLILGTGFNTCYADENSNIKKTAELVGCEGLSLINMESGGYAGAPRGLLDVEHNNGTANPGDHKFEKMISGGYQGSLMLTILKTAAREGLFSDEAASSIQNTVFLEAKDLTSFLDYPYSGDNPLSLIAMKGTAREHNAQTLFYLLDAFYERIARLVVSELAAVIQKTGKGSNPLSPICISAEGTTFYKSTLLRKKLDYHIKTYLNDELALYCEFVKVENSTIIGTAIAGILG